MLIAEELVLLVLEPDGTLTRGASYQPAVAVGVTGALVVELVQGGHVCIEDDRIRLTGTRPDHPVLAQALDNLAPHEGKKLKSRLGAVKHAGWNEVVDGMVAAGVIGREKELLRATRHPVKDVAAHARLRDEVRAAATGTEPMSDRVATLLALAGPCQQLEVVAPERSTRAHAKKRIAEATERVPEARAVKYVIQSMEAAVAVAVTAATVSSS